MATQPEKRNAQGPAARRQPAALTRRAALATGVALLTGCGRERDRPLFSADAQPHDYPTVQGVVEMGRILKERTNGRLSIKVFAGAQLGAERDTLEITAFGGLDLNRISLAPLNSVEPTTVVLGLPFVFRDTAHMRRAVDGPTGDEILASLERRSLIGLCYYDSGERCIYNTKRPIRTPADMRGMKIRVPNSDLYVSMIRALGADATPMEYGEVYQALAQGVIDGAENNWPSYHSARHFEPAPFYTLTRHLIAPEVLVMSKHRWEKLSPEDRTLVREAARLSVPFMRRAWDARVETAERAIRASGVAVNDVDDHEAFVALMRPVWDRFLVTPTQKRLVEEIEQMADADA